jgi:twitching motility protein PilT
VSIDFHRYIQAAIEHEASDVLLSVGSVPALRVDGELRALKVPPLGPDDMDGGLAVLLDDAQREQLREHRQLDFVVTLGERRLRGSAIHAGRRPSLALRLLPPRVPTPTELGLPSALVDALQQPWGLILATGPAGSGKTTTIASLVDVLAARRPMHVVTVEDPIEFIHAPRHGVIIDQQEVGFDTPSFAAALRQVLRHNPDVIMVGEIRDRETAEAVLAIAETGHLVLSTVHANDAVQALDRIISLFPTDQRGYVHEQLAMITNAIINQRLIPALKGGRVLAAELLRGSSSVAHLIRDGRTGQLHSVLERERSNGSQSMNFALDRLVAAQTISAEEARKHVNRFESPGAVLTSTTASPATPS